MVSFNNPKKKILRIADLFCGGGGSSTAIIRTARLLGYEVEMYMFNHWDIATNTQKINHPEFADNVKCVDLDSVNPRDYFKEGGLDVLIGSPECTYHSSALGGKPINDQSRATAWCVVRWIDALKPSIVLIENVPEFEGWGPLGSNKRPLKSKKGQVFMAWIHAIEALGYTVDWKVLCCADYGDPTTRRRIFIQAVRGKRKVVWPNPTHSPKVEADLFDTLKPWVPAHRIIDWNLQGKSIYSRKKPLSPNTLRRIMDGLKKYGLKPFIVPQHGEHGPRSTGLPVPTLTTTSRGVGLAAPFLITMEHGGGIRGTDIPIPTITTAKGGAIALANPELIPVPSFEDWTSDAKAKGRSQEDYARTFGLHHEACEQATPLPDFTKPFIVQLRGTSDSQIEGSAKSTQMPIGTITSGGIHHALVEPILIDGAGTMAEQDATLLEPHLLPQHAGSDSRPVTQPCPTVACDGAVALVEPFLVSYYGTGNPASINDPIESVTTKDRFGLVRPVVIYNGKRYLLDIRFRMLATRELAAAQGFPPDYRFAGNKTETVKQIGNAVPGHTFACLSLAVLTQQNNITEFLPPNEYDTIAA